MSLAKKAVRGAAWMVIMSIGSRLVGVVGTLLLTHLLAPSVIGEVAVASALVQTTRALSTFGFGQYIVASPKLGADGVFHATAFNLIFAVAGFSILLLIAEPLAPLFNSPTMIVYLPGLVVAGMIERAALIPERILVRDLRFRTQSITRAMSEICYAGSAVAFAYSGWGGESIVFGNIARACVIALIFFIFVQRSEWLSVCKLNREHTRALFRFGAPLWVSSNAALASRTWDNLLFSSYFGAARMGHYNLAYNLANIPTVNIGEHIADVLLPSFARLKPDERKRALLRANGLLALLIYPLAVGLGVVAPTLVAALFNEEWQAVAPYLLILSVLSVVRPVAWVITSYLQAVHRTRELMYLGLLKIALLMGIMAALGLISDLWACIGVGIAFGLNTTVSMLVIRHIDGLSMARMASGLIGPLLACGPLVLAVLGVRSIGIATPWIALVSEICAGGAAYVLAALVLARSNTADFFGLLKKNLLGR